MSCLHASVLVLWMFAGFSNCVESQTDIYKVPSCVSTAKLTLDNFTISSGNGNAPTYDTVATLCYLNRGTLNPLSLLVHFVMNDENAQLRI